MDTARTHTGHFEIGFRRGWHAWQQDKMRLWEFF